MRHARALALGSALVFSFGSLAACAGEDDAGGPPAAAAVAEPAAPPLPSPFGEPYPLVADWPTLPPGTFFGTEEGFPDQAARDRAAADRRAQASAAGQGGPSDATPAELETAEANRFGEGVSGIAIDDQDNVYVFNRGPRTVLVFDREGNFVRGGGESDANGVPIAGGWLHSGEVDREGNVWVVERDNHRILKLAPTLDRVLLQLGTAGEPGNDATHFDRPSGISVLRNGNLVVTDGYGNNRVVLFAPDGGFIRQVGLGSGGPDESGAGPAQFDLPHQAAVDALDNLYVVDRENHRIQVFDAELTYLREMAHPGWYPWDIAISRRGDDGFAYVADHAGERVHKMALADGTILATWGVPGRGPGQFDWVHGMAVDSEGAVYAADTYGQRVQKFVPGRAPG